MPLKCSLKSDISIIVYGKKVPKDLLLKYSTSFISRTSTMTDFTLPSQSRVEDGPTNKEMKEGALVTGRLCHSQEPFLQVEANQCCTDPPTNKMDTTPAERSTDNAEKDDGQVTYYEYQDELGTPHSDDDLCADDNGLLLVNNRIGLLQKENVELRNELSCLRKEVADLSQLAMSRVSSISDRAEEY